MILSLFLIPLSGIAVGTLCERLRVPALIAYLALGLLFGATGVLDEALLAISSEIRRAALVVILLRAELSTRFSELKKSGSAAVLLCFLPALAEMCAVGLIAPLLFPLDGTEAFLLGSVLAAVSPAVVVPRMLSLSERGLGAERAVPQTLTAGASADDIFVVLMFGIFLSAAKGGGFSLASLWLLPVSVLCGVAAGTLSALWNGLGHERAAPLLFALRPLARRTAQHGRDEVHGEGTRLLRARLSAQGDGAGGDRRDPARGGETVLSVAVASILLTAPLGAAAIEWGGKRLLAPAQGAMRESDHEKHPFV